jgi:hypothetical protein
MGTVAVCVKRSRASVSAPARAPAVLVEVRRRDAVRAAQVGVEARDARVVFAALDEARAERVGVDVVERRHHGLVVEDGRVAVALHPEGAASPEDGVHASTDPRLHVPHEVRQAVVADAQEDVRVVAHHHERDDHHVHVPGQRALEDVHHDEAAHVGRREQELIVNALGADQEHRVVGVMEARRAHGARARSRQPLLLCLKRPRSNGTTHLELTPTSFLSRLASPLSSLSPARTRASTSASPRTPRPRSAARRPPTSRRLLGSPDAPLLWPAGADTARKVSAANRARGAPGSWMPPLQGAPPLRRRHPRPQGAPSHPPEHAPLARPHSHPPRTSSARTSRGSRLPRAPEHVPTRTPGP